MDYKKQIFKIFDKFVKGVDTYHNNGSMWFIFTDDKKWVIELTNEGTLWYNFYFFQDCFKYLSLDVVENQHYITEWVESIIQNGVKSTPMHLSITKEKVESIIQNGVKSTLEKHWNWPLHVESIIQNGIKETIDQWNQNRPSVKDVIEKGVKKTYKHPYRTNIMVEDTIQNGVKHTEDSLLERIFFVEDTIENGVKETHHVDVMKFFDDKMNDTLQNGIKENIKIIKETHEDAYHNKGRVEGVIRNGIIETRHGIHFFEDTTENVIKNGIKETNPHLLEIYNPMNFEPEIKEMKRMNEVNIVLENGIKETIELPDKCGELNGYGEYYARQKNMTYPHTDIVNDVITDGIKEIKGIGPSEITSKEIDRVIKK